MKRKIASVVPGFPTALSVALQSDLIAMIPALYLVNQQVMEQVHLFELPFKAGGLPSRKCGIREWNAIPAHRWLREKIVAICRVDKSLHQKL